MYHPLFGGCIKLPLRRMYQIVYHYDSHYHSSKIGGNDLMFYMMVARAEHIKKPCLSLLSFPLLWSQRFLQASPKSMVRSKEAWGLHT
jgi:hypothetical protein